MPIDRPVGNNPRRIRDLGDFSSMIVLEPCDGPSRISQANQLGQTVPRILPHPVSGGDHLHQVSESIVLTMGLASGCICDGRDIPTCCISELNSRPIRVNDCAGQCANCRITGTTL